MIDDLEDWKGNYILKQNMRLTDLRYAWLHYVSSAVGVEEAASTWFFCMCHTS